VVLGCNGSGEESPWLGKQRGVWIIEKVIWTEIFEISPLTLGLSPPGRRLG
jgi:hypothetical protein